MVLVRPPGHASISVVRSADGTALSTAAHGPADARVTLLLAHGWCLDSTSWDPVLPLLLDRPDPPRIVTYDHRGHGRSGRDHRVAVRGGRASIATLADDLATVLAARAPTGPVVLAGHSMGGMTAMALGAAHPDLVRDRVAGVALVSTAARSAAGRLHASTAAGRAFAVGMRVLTAVPPMPPGWSARVPEPVRRFAPRESLAVTRSRRLLFGADSDPAQVRAAHRTIGRTALRTVGAWYGALSRHDEVVALAALSQVPVRVLVGERDLLTPPGEARFIAERLAADAVLDLMPDAGHMLPMERPQQVADHLTALVEGAR